METVAFCDHQKISLRGHGDDSKHQQDSATVNLGNFITYNVWCDDDDIVLAEHLSKYAKMQPIDQKVFKMTSLTLWR